MSKWALDHLKKNRILSIWTGHLRGFRQKDNVWHQNSGTLTWAKNLCMNPVFFQNQRLLKYNCKKYYNISTTNSILFVQNAVLHVRRHM